MSRLRELNRALRSISVSLSAFPSHRSLSTPIILLLLIAIPAFASIFRLEISYYGGGMVVSDPPGIACGVFGSSCSASYAPGTSVTLTATPAGGSVFSTWGGGACSGSSPSCTFTMDADKGTFAHFGTAWSPTTTSISSTTTTTLAGSSIPLVAGWNLVGTGAGGTLDVQRIFGDPAKVASVWKWVAVKSNWAFYSPMYADGGAAYAAVHGFDFLTTINPGDGFWVDSISAYNLSVPTGASVPSATFHGALSTGWNLIAIGDNKTPSSFNMVLGITPPSPGVIPVNLTTLWSWNAIARRWNFYSPLPLTFVQHELYCLNLYHCFDAGETIDAATGFWVNMP